jgi:hypothetical protein
MSVSRAKYADGMVDYWRKLMSHTLLLPVRKLKPRC